MPKNIVVYSDGTGQDGGFRVEQHVSNVYKMYRATRVADDTAINPSEQVAFYDPGLGTDIETTAHWGPLRFVQKLLASATGRGITTNIADCYEFIINNYEPGDRIFLIGFSRGAYTARCVANVLRLCGVPTADHGGTIQRFRRRTRDIAEEAVNRILEHGAGHPREKYEAEREELARRFRNAYGSNFSQDDVSQSNAAAYFVGVFDTVAALGSRGVVRMLILGCYYVLWGSIVFALAYGLSSLSHERLGMTLWALTVLIWCVGMIGVFIKRTLPYIKTISDFPKEGDFKFHIAEWKGNSFDKLLPRNASFARSANAIDETRKDFDRVKWGSISDGTPDEVDGHTRIIQMWFAGNHSDVGGSYSEVESRLSDIPLAWMIEHSAKLGLKCGPVFVKGEKIEGTGDLGQPTYLFPAADGVQHCEVASMRDYLDGLRPPLGWLMRSRNWEVIHREIQPEATVHSTVTTRFELRSVKQCSGSGPYRPESLQNHNKFKKYYEG